jgi:GNAT superfamily N-acetyltransferase
VEADGAFVETLLLADALEALADVPDPPRSHLAAMQVSARAAAYRQAWPDAVDWVVEVDGSPAGRLLTAQTAAGVHIVDVRLCARWRGHGVGTVLLAALSAEADKRRWPVSLTVDPASPARRLYDRAGFVRVPATGGGAELAIRLERPVAAGG